LHALNRQRHPHLHSSGTSIISGHSHGSWTSPPAGRHQSSGGALLRPVLLASACTCCTSGYGTSSQYTCAYPLYKRECIL
jgi:hypothetical protein